MWKAAFTGRSEKGGSRSEAGRSEAGSVSGERRKKSSRSTRGDNESVVSSATRRDDDRDRKRSSRYENSSTAGGSVYATPPSSMYGTAPSSRVGDGYSQARPLTESALRMLPNDDDEEWEDEEDGKSRKSSSRKKRGSSDEREKRHNSSGKEKEAKRSSSRERREQKKKTRSSTSEKEKKARRPEAEVVREGSRAIPDMGSLEQFPGQYAGAVMGAAGEGDYVMSGALPASVPNTQFPGQGQDASGYSVEMQHPGLDRAESFGHAAEYYLDQGESVRFQPGVRASTPNMLVNPDAHLHAASAEAHPAADTGNGAAADFYTGTVSPVFSTPQPAKPSRPSKQSASAPSSASHPKTSSSHPHSQSEQPASSPSPFRPQSTHSDYPPTIKPSSSRPGRHSADASTYYAAPPPPTNPYGSTAQAGTTGVYATSTSMNASGSDSQAGATGAYGTHADFNTTGTYSGRQSTNANVPLYAAAGAGAAAAGYAAYQHQHNRHHSNTANFASGDFGQGPPRSPKPPGFAGGGYYGPPGGGGGMMQQQHHFHEHKGPMTRLKDGILNLIASPEDTAKMEMYTEYIGVCKHCFDPRTSAWDAPRVHHYHKRKDSFESLRRRASYDRLGRKRSSERIDKDNRYYASESSKRRRDERASGIGMMGAGLAAAGAATASAALFHDRKNFDDTYSVKSGHRESSALRRRSRSSSREQRRQSTHGVLRPEGEYVTVRKKDGTVERRRVVRSRSRSRSATRKSSVGFGLGTAAAAGAALGAAALAAHAGRRSRSSSRERRRRSSAYSPTRYDRSGSPKDQGGIFGNFFSPSSRQRRGSHEKKKKNRGFFTFSNGSSSSSNSELAFGDPYLSRKGSRASLRRKSSTRSSKGRAGRRKSDDHLAATVAGIGATAAALAAAQKGHRISKRGSRPELGAKRQVRTHVPGHRHGSPGSSDPDWEDELQSDVDDASSVDGGLAFGDYGDRRLSSRQSLESVASSNDGGLGAWGWRWGGKDKNGRKIRRSSSPQSWRPTGSQGSLSGPIAAGLTAGASGAAFDTSEPVQPQQSVYIDDTGRPLPTADNRSSTSGSSLPLQYVDPQPINSDAGTPRHSMPGAFDAEAPIYRPAQGPIAQPQPVTPTQPAFTQPGADFGYTATSSPADARPGMPRRTQSSPVQSTWMKDAAAIGGGALAAGAIIAGASALNGSAASGASGRRSKDPNSRVSFGLTSEQQRKENRERRKEEQRAADDERRRSDRARAVKEEAERAARESRQEEIRQQREDENRQAAEVKLAKLREEEAERARQEAEKQRQIAEEKARQDRERQWEIERLEKEARDRAAAAEVARQELEKQRKAREEAERAQAELERQRREREENYAREQARLADEARRQDEERKQWEAERYASEWQSASRQGYGPEQKRPSASSWAAPLAGAAAAATVGAVMAGREHEKRRDSSDSPKSRRRSRRSGTEDELERAAKEKYGERANVELRDGYAAAEIKPMNEHSGEPLMDDDIYDPDYFKRKQQGVRREELARKAAEKVVASRERSTSPYFEHDAYANFFKPADLGTKAGYTESNPHPDADVVVYHARNDDAHYYFPQDQAWPKGPHFDEFVSKGTRARSKSAPFGVPRLNVMAPTPPPEEQDKRRRRPGPLPPSSLSKDADPDEEGSTSTKSSGKSERSRSISWGEDKYHTYDVQTPDSYQERESYITSPDAAKVAGVVAGKALHEVIVEEPSGRKSRDYTYDDNDFGKDTYNTETPADEEEGVEEIERTPEAETKFSRAGLGDAAFYQQPFYESVSDVGSRFQMPSPGTEGAPFSRGFVEEMEISDDTPAEEKRVPGTWDDEEADIYRPTPKSMKETDAVSGAERDVPRTSEEPAWEPPLSKKEKKKREEAAKKSGDFESFYSGIPTPPELERVQTLDEEVVGSPGGIEGEYFPPPPPSKNDNKKKKKSGTGLSFADLVSEVFAQPGSPAELQRVQTLEDSEASTPKKEAADEYFPALSKKEKKKREKEAKKQGFADIVAEASGPKDDNSTLADTDTEQSRDAKGKKSGSSLADLADGILAAGGVAAAATALNGSNDSASESPSGSSSKKDKKKKRKSKLGESTFDDPRDQKPEAEPVDTTKPPLSGVIEKEPIRMPGGWDESESPPRKASIDEPSQVQAKEEQTSAGVQESSTSQEADPWEWSAPTSKKNKKKSKRSSLANQPEVSSPLRSEVAWDDYTSAKVTAEPESYNNDYGFPTSNKDAKSDASRSEPVTVIDTSKPPLSQAWNEPKPQANTSAYRSSDDKPQEREGAVPRSPEEKRESRSDKASADIERKLSGSQKSASPDDARSVVSESAAERRRSRREEYRRGSDYASGYDQPDYAYETQSVAASEPAYPGAEEKRRKRRSKHEDDDDDTRSVISSRSRRDKDEKRRSKHDDEDTASVTSSRSRREREESPSVKKEKKGLFGGLFGRTKSFDGTSSSSKDKDRDGAPLSRSSTRDSKDRDDEHDNRRRRKQKHRDSEYGDDVDDTRSVKSESHRRHRSAGDRDDDKDSHERKRRSTHEDRDESRSALSESGHRHHHRRRTDDDGESRDAVSESGHRHHSRRSTADELGRDSRDQSFLGNRVEGLPPLPASRPVSPDSAVERREGRPLEAESGRGSMVKDAVLVGGAVVGASLLADALSSKSSDDKYHADDIARSAEHDQRYDEAHKSAVAGVVEPETPAKAREVELSDASLSAERPASLQRPVSSTAVPLRFPFGHAPTTPGSADRTSATERAKSFSSPSPAAPLTAGSPTTPSSAKSRQSRPHSSEFKGVMPLYLVERNRQTPEVEEGLPSLPSSKPSSRASSVHGSDDGFQSAAEEWDSPSASHRNLPALDLAGIGAASYQSEDETTPKATHFPLTAIPWTASSTTPTAEKREKQQPQFFTWDDYVQDEKMHEQQEEKEASREDPSFSKERNRSTSPSKAKALAAAAMLGTAAVYGKQKLDSQSSEQVHDRDPVGPKHEYPLPAPLAEPTPTEPAETPEASGKGSKKEGEKSKKQILDTEAPADEPERELERQDTEDFFDAESHAEEGTVSRERGQPAPTEVFESAHPKNALDRFLSDERHAEEGDGHFFASAAAHTIPAINVQQASPDAERRAELNPEEQRPQDGGYFASTAAHTMPVLPRLKSEEGTEQSFEVEHAKEEGSIEEGEAAMPLLQRDEPADAEDERPATAYKIPEAKSEPAPLVIDERTVVAAPEATVEVAPAPQLTRKQSKKAKKKQRASTIFEDEPQTAVEDSPADGSGTQTPANETEAPREESASQFNFGLSDFSQIAHDNTWGDSQAEAFQTSMDRAASKPRLGSVHDVDGLRSHDVEVDDVHSPVEGRTAPATSVPAPWATPQPEPETEEWTASSSSSKKRGKKDKKKKPAPSWSEEPSEAEHAESSTAGLAVGALAGVAAAAAVDDWSSSSSSGKKGKKDKKKKPPTWSEPEGVDAGVLESRDESSVPEQDTTDDVAVAADGSSQVESRDEPHESEEPVPAPETSEVADESSREAQTPAVESEAPAADDFFPIVSKKKAKKGKKGKADWDEETPVEETGRQDAEDESNANRDVVPDSQSPGDPAEEPRELVNELPDVHTPVAEIVQPDESAAQSALESFAPVSSKKKSKKDKKKSKAATWDEFEPVSETAEPEPDAQEEIVAETGKGTEVEQHQAIPEVSDIEAITPEPTTDAIDEVHVEEKPALSRKQSKKDKKKKKSALARDPEPDSTVLESDKQEESGEASAEKHDEPVIPTEALNTVLNQCAPDDVHEKAETAKGGELVIPPESLNTVLQSASAQDTADAGQVAEQPSLEENVNDDFKPTLTRKQSKKDEKKKKASAWEPEPESEPTPSDTESRDFAKADEGAHPAGDDIVIPSEALNTVLQQDTSHSPPPVDSKAETEKVDHDFQPTLPKKQSKKDKKKRKSLAWDPETETDSQTEAAITIQNDTGLQEPVEASTSKEDVIIPQEALNTVLQSSAEPADTSTTDEPTTETIEKTKVEEKPALTRKQSKKDKKKKKSSAFEWETQPEPDVQNESSLPGDEPTRNEGDLTVPPEALNTVIQTEDSRGIDSTGDANKPALSRKQSKKDKKEKKKQSPWEPEPEPEVEDTPVAAQSSSELIEQAAGVPLPPESPDESFHDNSFHDAEEFNDTQAPDTFHEAAEISAVEDGAVTNVMSVDEPSEPIKQSWADEMEAADPSATRPSHERHDSNLVDDVFGIANESGELHGTLSNDQRETPIADRGLEFEPERATEDMDAFGEASPRASADWTGFSKKKGKKGKKGAKKSGAQTPVVEESVAAEPASETALLDDQHPSPIERPDQTQHQEKTETSALEPASTKQLPEAEVEHALESTKLDATNPGHVEDSQDNPIPDAHDAPPEQNSTPADDPEEQKSIDDAERVQEQPLEGTQRNADELTAGTEQLPTTAEEADEFTWSAPTKKGKKGKKGKKSGTQTPQATEEPVAMTEFDRNMPAEEQTISTAVAENQTADVPEPSISTEEALPTNPTVNLPQSGPESSAPAVAADAFDVDKNAHDAEPEEEFAWTSSKKKGKKGNKSRQQSVADLPSAEDTKSAETEAILERDVANEEASPRVIDDATPVLAAEHQAEPTIAQNEPADEFSWASSSKKKKGKKGKKDKKSQDFEPDAGASESPGSAEPATPSLEEQASGFVKEPIKQVDENDKPSEEPAAAETEDIRAMPTSKKNKKGKKGKTSDFDALEQPQPELCEADMNDTPIETATPQRAEPPPLEADDFSGFMTSKRKKGKKGKKSASGTATPLSETIEADQDDGKIDMAEAEVQAPEDKSMDVENTDSNVEADAGGVTDEKPIERSLEQEASAPQQDASKETEMAGQPLEHGADQIDLTQHDVAAERTRDTAAIPDFSANPGQAGDGADSWWEPTSSKKQKNKAKKNKQAIDLAAAEAEQSETPALPSTIDAERIEPAATPSVEENPEAEHQSAEVDEWSTSLSGKKKGKKGKKSKQLALDESTAEQSTPVEENANEPAIGGEEVSVSNTAEVENDVPVSEKKEEDLPTSTEQEETIREPMDLDQLPPATDQPREAIADVNSPSAVPEEAPEEFAFTTKKSKKDKKKAKKAGASMSDSWNESTEPSEVPPEAEISNKTAGLGAAAVAGATAAAGLAEKPAEEDEWAGFSTKKSKKDKKKGKKSGASTPAVVEDKELMPSDGVEDKSMLTDSAGQQEQTGAAEQFKDLDVDLKPSSESVEPTRPSPDQGASQDIDFAATVAAGLADSGFDPDMVINDPVFHRRASPTGQAEADPEEVISTTTTSKRKKNKKSSDSRDLSGEASPAISSSNLEDKPAADDVNDIINKSLGGAGFDPDLIEKAMASNNTSSADIDNDQPEISFATSKRKKGKKAKNESASGTEWWQASAPQEDLPDVQAAQTTEKDLQAPAEPSTDNQKSEHGWLVQEELDIDAGDKAYREYKKKKRQQRKLKAAGQAGVLSDHPESAMDDTERSTAVSDSETGLSRATTKDERPPQPLPPVLEKAARPTSAPSESADATTSPTNSKSIVSSVFPGLQRVKRRAPSIPSGEEASQQARRSSSGSQSRALLHTSEVSQHLPVEVPRTPPQEHERRLSDTGSKDHASALYKAAAGVAAISTGAAIASALDKKQSEAGKASRCVPADEPSWSFAALQDDKQHQPIRDSGYQEGKRASQQTERSSGEIPEILHTSSSFDSLRQRRSLEPLRISTPSSPEKQWNIHTAEKRGGPSDKNSLEAHARTPSAETPLLPTSKNRTSYLFQSPPDILAEATDARTPTHTSEHGTQSRAGACSRGSEASPVPRTDGANDRSAFSPTSPRTPLDPIPEERQHARKRSKASHEVGGAEHVKAIKRTETRQKVREEERALSPNIRPSVTTPSGGSTRSTSNALSTSDEVYNRLSWPAVDEEHETVHLDRRHASQARTMPPDPRSPSVTSNKSPQELRSHSRNSHHSNRSSTPSLRRISLSGDLRAAAASRRGLSDAGSAVSARSSPQTIPFVAPPTPPLNDDEIAGSASRAVDMNDDVFVGCTMHARDGIDADSLQQGYGDAQQQAQVSPTRPPSVRKRQSMHITELESRLDQLVAENRALHEAREAEAGALHSGALRNGQSLQEMLNARDLQLRAKDAEINQIKAMLQPMQEELQRLADMNAGLTEANRNLVDDTNRRYATLQAEHSQAHEQWQSTAKDLEHMRAEHGRITSGMRDIVEAEIANALADKNAEILRLREQLDIAAEQIRALQLQIQGSKSSDFLVQRDEDYFDGACQKLCQHVQQWVLRFSKMSDNRVCRLSTDLNDDKIEARLDNAILDGSDVDKLLGDRVRRRDVFMSVVMTMVWEYVFTRYLFGMDREQRQKLKTLEKLLSEVGPPRAVAHWRATTLTLLAKRPQFEDQCSLDTEAVANEVFEVLCRLLPPPSASRSQLLASLLKVLRIAVDLSIEMRTQRAEYIMLPPLQPEYDTNGDLVRKVYFNASLMNERSGFFSSNEELAAQHAVVKVVLFPLVVKKGDDVGEGEEEIVVCPAQVLVQNDNGKGKKVVRVMSGAMEIDDPIRSTKSRQSNRSLLSDAPGSVGF